MVQTARSGRSADVHLHVAATRAVTHIRGAEQDRSIAGVRYKKGEAEIRVTIADSAHNALMLVPFSWVGNRGYEKGTETGYEKAVKVAGFPPASRNGTPTQRTVS
jgi:hypothetical protein